MENESVNIVQLILLHCHAFCFVFCKSTGTFAQYRKFKYMKDSKRTGCYEQNIITNCNDFYIFDFPVLDSLLDFLDFLEYFR